MKSSNFFREAYWTYIGVGITPIRDQIGIDFPKSPDLGLLCQGGVLTENVSDWQNMTNSDD